MVIGSKLYRMHTCNDSMEWAKSHIDDAPDGAIFLADVLTKARGRQGRVWSVAPGQLIVTVLLKPAHLALISQEDLPIRLNQLNMALSVGILDALSLYGAGIKWPNDIMLQDKKLGGILMQLVWRNNVPAGIILGFALNVNNTFTADDSLAAIATSLIASTGSAIDMRSLYKEIIHCLDERYTAWCSGDFDLIYRLWKKAQLYLGKELSVHQRDGLVITGTMAHVLPYGDMLLNLPTGKQAVVPFYHIEEIEPKLPH